MNRRFGSRALLAWGALGVAVTMSGLACTLILPLDDQQCSNDGDCRARGAAFASAVCQSHLCTLPTPMPDAAAPMDAGMEAEAEAAPRGPFTCLDDPPQMLDPSRQAVLDIHIINGLDPNASAGSQDGGGSDLVIVKGTPLPGVNVRVCNLLDVGCTMPVGTTLVSDDAGLAQATVAENFSGFLDFGRSDLLPQRIYLGNLIAGAPSDPVPVGLLPLSSLSLLAGALGIPLDTDPDGGAGHFFFTTYDCFDHYASGISMTIDKHEQDTQGWYLVGGLPSTMATATGTLGSGGYVNVPVGGLTATAKLAATGRTIATFNIVIRPGVASEVWVRPRVH